MGGFLDAPKKDKETENGQNKVMAWGACGMQGWRSSMEDAHICESVELPKGESGMLFGVFDGHGGDEVAKYVKANFKKEFVSQKNIHNNDYKKALIDTFLGLDKSLKNQYYATSIGTTACVVLITPDAFYCANAGDSRAVLCQTVKRAVPLSEDHKPDLPEETRRIQAAGHFVSEERVDGQLALSRALGDHNFKDKPAKKAEEQAVSPLPDVTVRKRNSADQFIMVACDGIWDCVTNEECVSKITDYYKEMKCKTDNVCPPVARLFDEICPDEMGDGIGTDNMTAILVKFK